MLELLREVGTEVEAVITAHEGQIVKRLGDGVMASFLSAARGHVDIDDQVVAAQLAGTGPVHARA